MNQKEFSQLQVGDWFRALYEDKKYKILSIEKDGFHTDEHDMRMQRVDYAFIEFKRFLYYECDKEPIETAKNSHWISCKDSLPNKGKYVFVRMNDNTCFVASLENDKFYDNVE